MSWVCALPPWAHKVSILCQWICMWVWRAQSKFGQFSSLPWLLLSLLCCVYHEHLCSFKVVWECVTGRSLLRSLLCLNPVSARNVFVPAIQLQALLICQPLWWMFHIQYFQVWVLPAFPNWVTLTMTEKLPILLRVWPALTEARIHQAWGKMEQPQYFTDSHSYYPKLSSFFSITVLRLLYDFGQFPKHWNSCISFV